jgi:hypothetical protein
MSYKNATPQKQADGTFVLSYQVTDAQGQPVGSKSVFTGSTEAECYSKAMQAHQNAQLAVERLRKRQPTYRPGQEPATIPEMVDRAAAAERNANENAISFKWLQNHLSDSEHPFFRCDANANILKSYLDDNGLEWTVDNLELAYDNCEDRLAKGHAPVPTSETPAEIIPTMPKTPFDHIRTPDDIKTMSKQAYGDLYRSERWGTEFKKHINAILAGGN